MSDWRDLAWNADTLYKYTGGLMKDQIKKLIFWGLGSNIRTKLRIKRIKSNHFVTILNLHRVSPNDFSSYAPLEPKLFDQLLGFLKEHYFLTTFSSLEQFENNIPSKPLMILSFDDGYKDFLEYACPILAKHGIRVNQNLIPECVISGEPPLNVTLQDFIGKASDSELKYLIVPGLDYTSLSKDRFKLGNSLSKFIKNKPKAEQEEYRYIILDKIKNLDSFKPTEMMNLSDAKEIAGIHELGAHSFSHANIGIESDEYALNDFEMCKLWFKESLNFNVDIYAFPNGSYKDHQIKFALSAGYKHILLVNDKFSAAQGPVYERFGFHANTFPEARFRLTGKFTKV